MLVFWPSNLNCSVISKVDAKIQITFNSSFWIKKKNDGISNPVSTFSAAFN